MYLGIDLGTSSAKAVVLAPNGAIAAHSSHPLEVSRPCPMWSEQDPDDWWRAVDQSVLRLDPDVRRRVSAIGLTGQMHGATLLGTDDRPLRPAILWNDGRSHAECAALERAEPNSRAITGNIAMPGFTAPKLLWARSHEPDVFDRLCAVLLPKDYVRLCMTGQKASDMSDSAGTLWLDVGARTWSEAMLAASGVERGHMPMLYEGSECTGTLRAAVAARWGIGAVPVAAGAGDNAAGAIGMGAIDDGEALLSLGTSGVIFVATDSFRPNPEGAVHAFCHGLADRWHLMAVHLSAASCLDWAAVQLRLPGAADVLRVAEAAGAGVGPEIFLPFLSGERTPHNDPCVRAAFVGLDNETTPDRLCAAVLEGVAFALSDGLAALRAGGAPIERLAVIGGGARSRYWGAVLASVLGVPLDYHQQGEIGPALGAARLALIAATGATPREVCTRPAASETIDPDPAIADRLAPKLARYRQSCAVIRSIH
jgi:xylulokinase